MAKRIFSGIQPSGNLHIGNYLGAIQNWVKLQNEYESIFCVVDMHAITVPQDPRELRKRTIEIAKIYLAAGIDPEKSSLFIQSHVSEHAELAWILNTITKIGDLTKMTQLKDKAGFEEIRLLEKITPREIKILEALEKSFSNYEKVAEEFGVNAETIENYEKDASAKIRESYLHKLNTANVGLFDYPVLMAADILLYDTNLVPVGEDQFQHLELTRTLAKRFNQKFGDTFTLPESYSTKESARIMGLDNPKKKMSKSAPSEYNFIALTDDEETVKRKIKKAVTDSGSEIVYSKEKPALKNLINIYSLLSDKSTKDVENMYQNRNYADFKNDLADVVINFLRPFQEQMEDMNDEKVLEILRAGARKVRPLAQKKLQEVKEKIGFIQ